MISNKLTKICFKCKAEKSVSEFQKDSYKSDGLCSYCKICVAPKNREYLAKHKERRKEYLNRNKARIQLYQKQYSKRYRADNKEKLRRDKKEYRDQNKEKVRRHKKESYQQNRNRILEQCKQYRNSNKEGFSRKRKERYARPDVKIICSLRGRIRKVFKGRSKSKHSLELLGCNAKEFKDYLEKQFKSGMAWENYGKGNGKWNIDHIVPCAFFNIIDPIEQQQCFHYTNHQPLWERGVGGNSEKLDRTEGLNLLYHDPTPFLK